MATGSNALINTRPDLQVSGSFSFAPKGTAVPTSAATPLPAAYLDAGYSNEDGWTLTEDASDTPIKIFGGMTARKVREDFTANMAGGLKEFGNPVTLRVLYGDENVVYDGATGTIALTGNPNMTESMVFVFDFFDGPRHVRVVIPNGQLSRTGDIPFSHNDVVSFSANIECQPDDNGKPYYIYIEGLEVEAPAV